LVDEALASRVFEANVSHFPVLTDLFREYEKAMQYSIEGFKFSDVDDSCQRAYEDSVSNAGDFDKDYYRDREYLYKKLYSNKTDVKINICNTKAEFGCCQEPLVDDCCFCTYDGKVDVWKDVLPHHKPLKTASKTMRGFGLSGSDMAGDLRDFYGVVLRRLGYNGTRKQLKSYKYLKNFSYMPPEGFLMWHTNEHDNTNGAYRYVSCGVNQRPSHRSIGVVIAILFAFPSPSGRKKLTHCFVVLTWHPHQDLHHCGERGWRVCFQVRSSRRHFGGGA